MTRTQSLFSNGKGGASAAGTAVSDIDTEKVGQDLVRLVLALVETIRQLVEKQAIRRVECGTLSEEEIERLGIALMLQEEKMNELKEHFGLSDDDLKLHLGPLDDFLEGVRLEG
jgi:hypothetical protein